MKELKHMAILFFMIIAEMSGGCTSSKQDEQTKQTKSNPMQFMKHMIESYRDKVHGGIYHTLSEEWSTPVDTDKYCADHFLLARTYVFQNMMTGNPEARDNAKTLADFTVEKFEDAVNGGFYLKASREWNILDKEKNPRVISTAFATLMHLYEITFDDHYLLKCFDLLDLLLNKCWDKTHGGFFDSYSEDWNPTTSTKSLHTQMEIILHLAGAWKDGIDSPYAARAEQYHQKAMDITNLVIAKMYDHQQGGFFKSCAADWSVIDDHKDVDEQCAAITTLFFIYQNLGPVLWGPREGSHAFSPNRDINDNYSYRGPSPDPRPITNEAYNIGKMVYDTAMLILQKAWDGSHRGFLRILSNDWVPLDRNKSLQTQADCLTALNIAYKLSGLPTLKDTIAEMQKAIVERAQDPVHLGFYEECDPEWKPLDRKKSFSINLGVFGALGMTMPTVMNPPVSPVKLKVWIEPENQSVEEGSSALYEVMIQNQGFLPEQVRLGGMMALSRWMEPGEFTIELAPHQVYTYTLKVTPPAGLRGKTYPFEVAAIAKSHKKRYFSDIAFITIK